MTEVVRLSRRVQATADVLWQAVATPRGLEAWQAEAVSGEVEPGQTLVLHYRSLGVSLDLLVETVEPGRRLVLVSGGTRLELSVRDGSVELLHCGLGAGDEAEGTRSSWQIALATLAEAVERYPGRRRFPQGVAMPVQASAELCHLYFAHPAALARWLLVADTMGDIGDRVSGHLFWGPALTGRLLACCPGRDVAFSWEEVAAVLALRTLPSPRRDDERLLYVSASAWGAPLAAETMHGLRASLARLVHQVASPGVA